MEIRGFSTLHAQNYFGIPHEFHNSRGHSESSEFKKKIASQIQEMCGRNYDLRECTEALTVYINLGRGGALVSKSVVFR
jgi:hypothetical protein